MGKEIRLFQHFGPLSICRLRTIEDEPSNSSEKLDPQGRLTFISMVDMDAKEPSQLGGDFTAKHGSGERSGPVVVSKNNDVADV